MRVGEGWGQYRIAEHEGGSVIGFRVVAVPYNYGESRVCTMFTGGELNEDSCVPPTYHVLQHCSL